MEEVASGSKEEKILAEMKKMLGSLAFIKPMLARLNYIQSEESH